MLKYGIIFVGVMRMNIGLIIAGVVVLVVLMKAYNVYVALIKTKNKTLEAFSAVSVQLKKRYDLIPNILEIANKFMEHERGLMEEITQLRTQAMKLPSDIDNINLQAKIDTQIRDKMGQIMVAVENYPQLKSDQTMVSAMQTYNEVEEHIAAARRFYNSAVLELNNMVEIFPTSVVASMVNVSQKDFFQIDEQETQAPKASDYLK